MLYLFGTFKLRRHRRKKSKDDIVTKPFVHPQRRHEFTQLAELQDLYSKPHLLHIVKIIRDKENFVSPNIRISHIKKTDAQIRQRVKNIMY